MTARILTVDETTHPDWIEDTDVDTSERWDRLDDQEAREQDDRDRQDAHE